MFIIELHLFQQGLQQVVVGAKTDVKDEGPDQNSEDQESEQAGGVEEERGEPKAEQMTL